MKKPVELYLVGGITGLIGGLLMLVLSYLFVFRLQDATLGIHDQFVGIGHGLGVVSLVLILPTVAALFVLLNTVVTARSFLGIGFAMVWIVVEMIGHLSQTGPLRALHELYNVPLTRETAVTLYGVSQEFWEAFARTGTFFSALMALCYGLALIADWNRPSGYLFLLSIIGFPIGMFLPNVGVQLHIALRGLAFFIVAGVLIKIALSAEE